MAEKKQSFRFRLPWRNRGSKSQVEPEPRPVAKAQNPAQTTANVPVERPTFRPAGRAPEKASPSRAQAPSRTEHPPPSPSRANESQKPSGSTTETQIQVESSPPSPSHVASQAPKAASQVSSPQTQPQPTVRESSQLLSLSAQTPSPASQPEPKEAISQLNAEIITSETNAQNNTPRETTVQVHPALAEEETIVSPGKVDHDTIGEDQKQLPESETREITLQTHPALAEEEPIASPEKVDPDTTGGDQKPLPESETRETTLQTHPALAEAEPIASPEKVDPDTIGGDQKQLPESETRETTLQTHPALAEAEPIASPEKVDPDTIGGEQKQLPESETRETTFQTHPALAEAEPIASPEKVDPDNIGGDQKQLPESETRETTLQTHPALAEAEPIASPEKVDPDTIRRDQKQLPESDTRETTLQTHPALAEAETIASPEKVDPDTVGGDQKQLPESETESKDDKEGKKVVQVLTKEEKTNDPGYREPMQETVTRLNAAVTGSGEHTKGLVGVASQTEQQHKKQETLDRTETLATTSSGSKPIKTPKESDGSTSKMSIQTMVSSTGEQASPHKEIRDDALKLHKLATGNQMLENLACVIAFTGEDRGALMHLSSEPAKDEESVQIHSGYKRNPDDGLESTTDGEVNKENIFKDETSREDQQIGAYINSNVQSINNAIVFNSSVTERNPVLRQFFLKTMQNQ